MKKNLINHIAKLLEIKPGEPFYVMHDDGRKARYRFTYTGIQVYEETRSQWTEGAFILPQLVLGMVEIKKETE